MWGALLSAVATAKAASGAKDMLENAVTSIIVGTFALLAIIFLSVSIFYGLSPSWGPARAAFTVALLLAAIGLMVHYATSGKAKSSSGDFLANPGAALSELTSSDNLDYAQREVTKIVKANPLKLSLLAIVAGVVLARRL